MRSSPGTAQGTAHVASWSPVIQTRRLLSPTRSPLRHARKPIQFAPSWQQMVRSSAASVASLPNGAICFPLQTSISEGKMASPTMSTTTTTGSTEASTPQAGGSTLLGKGGPATPSTRSSRGSMVPLNIPIATAVQTQPGPPVQSARGAEVQSQRGPPAQFRSPALSFREIRPRRSASIGPLRSPLTCPKSPITSPRPTPALVLTEAMAHSRSLRVGVGSRGLGTPSVHNSGQLVRMASTAETREVASPVSGGSVQMSVATPQGRSTPALDGMEAALLRLVQADTSLKKLGIRRLSSGLYVIDGRRVRLAWGAKAELLASEEKLTGQDPSNGPAVPLTSYLRQAADVKASLEASAVSRIPQEKRLSFDAPGLTVQDREKADLRTRCALMKQAVEEARLRAEAAEAYEKGVTYANPGSPPRSMPLTVPDAVGKWCKKAERPASCVRLAEALARLESRGAPKVVESDSSSDDETDDS
eukprot:s1185_g4.t2